MLIPAGLCSAAGALVYHMFNCSGFARLNATTRSISHDIYGAMDMTMRTVLYRG